MTLSGLVGLARALNATFKYRAMFYAVGPWDVELRPVDVDPGLESVPEVINSNIRAFFVMLVLETLWIYLRSSQPDKHIQINDTITSMATGVMSRLPDLFFKSIELLTYCLVYRKIHLYEMPLDSGWTWLATIIAVDFGWYWFHRVSHEVNIVWALHQPHHSSEYYNLSTAARKGVFQKLGSFIFYLPLAVVIPPPMFALHVQLNLIYQFWIHTEMIGRLWWPLEFLLNTPSHHRVHHGRNPYCIDRNYGGLLIVWDRLFDTFQAELEHEPVVYGLVHNLNTFDAATVQFNHFAAIIRKIAKQPANLLQCLFYGPGWSRAKPNYRLGDPGDLPKVDGNKINEKFDPPLARWVSVYCVVHAIFASLSTGFVLDLAQRPPLAVSSVVAAAFVATSLSFGNMFNRRDWLAAKFEVARCLAICLLIPWFCAECGIINNASIKAIQAFFAVSTLIWLFANSKPSSHVNNNNNNKNVDAKVK